MRSAITAIIFVIGLTSQAFATSIIIVRTPTDVFIGADSKERKGSSSEGACKIIITGKSFWTFANVVTFPPINFDLKKIALAFAARHGSWDDKIEALKSEIIPQIKIIVGEYRKVYKNWKEGEDVSTVAFGYFENGISHLHVIGFIPITKAGIISIYIHNADCPGATCSPVFKLGLHEALDRMKENEIPWEKFGITGTIYYLVQTEINASPNDVGPPISIVDISNAGANWITPGVCAPK
ncbi:MAG: hypothetical protein P4L81_02390 [Candidatus Pacebacteria bacterium]|nr:hypothetical protein [Candidatus Paceibacterota bacterium]